MDEEEKVAAAYRQMYAAMINKDIAALNGLLAEDFVLIHMTGMRQSKAAFLRTLAEGTLNYFAAEHEEITSQISENTAAFCGKSRVNAAVFGGGRYTWRLRLDLQLKKESMGWKISRAVASTY